MLGLVDGCVATAQHPATSTSNTIDINWNDKPKHTERNKRADRKTNPKILLRVTLKPILLRVIHSMNINNRATKKTV